MPANPNREASQDISGTWINSPANADNVFTGAQEIRSTRAGLRAALSQEHHTEPTEPGIATGEHVVGSAKCYVESGTDLAAAPGGSPESLKGRMRFNEARRQLLIHNGTENGWLPMGGVYPGLVSMSFVKPIPEQDGWVVLEGQTIDRVDSEGNPTIYDALIRRLTNSLTPPGSLTLPNLQNQFVRGVDAAGTRAPKVENTTAIVDEQEHAFQQHTHKMDHTHGANVVNGRDTGAGRTGVIAATGWNEGAPTITNDGSHRHNFVAIRGTRRTSDRVGIAVKGAEDPSEGTTVENDLSDHHHEIPRYNGITGTAGNAENVAFGLTENSYNTANETRPDNVAFYYVMKL